MSLQDNLDDLDDLSTDEPEWWELVSLASDPSNLPQLPPELWERILDLCDTDVGWEWDEAYLDRQRAFAAFCLTCRAWLPRSRYHLFKHVLVRSKEQVKQVSKLLSSIPALRTRVEVLEVRGKRDRKEDAVSDVVFVNRWACADGGKQVMDRSCRLPPGP